MKLTIAHTPDADDAFMFYGMVEGGVDLRGLELEHHIEPISQLNLHAHQGRFEITAMSFFAYSELFDRYRPLASGVSFGHGYGPRIIARKAQVDRSGALAIPGARTTSALLAREYGWKGEFLERPFAETPAAVASGEAEAALIIHEEQLLFEQHGFQLIVDLGAWWAERHGGLPLPLGVNCVRRDIPEAIAARYAAVFRDSIACALANREAALDYSMQFARAADREVARKFVGMYVNESTLGLSPEGALSVGKLLALTGQDVNCDFISAES